MTNTYELNIVNNEKELILSLSTLTIESDRELYDADSIVRDFFNVSPSNTAIVSDKTRCVVGDGFVVLVTKK